MKRILITMFLAFPLYALAETSTDKGAKTDETTETAAAEIISLKGTIGDMKNYKPLEGVTLTITSRESDIEKTIKTDAQGKFSANIPAGVYKVRFEKNGYQPGTYQSLTVHEGRTNSFGFLLYED